jgi:hypothetical protein
VSFAAITLCVASQGVLLLLLLLLLLSSSSSSSPFISLWTQSGNFWIYPRSKMDIKEMGWEGVDWIRLAQGMVKRRDLPNTGGFHERRVTS